MSIGYRHVKDFVCILPHIAQRTIKVTNEINAPPQLGSVATIERRRRNITTVPLPNNFLDTIRFNIGYGKRTNLGGTKSVLLLVDRAT